MKRRMQSNVLIDTLHKGFVCTCVGVTLYGTYLLGWRFYRYFTVLRPEKQQRELLSKEALLAEGSSDKLEDSAPQIKL